MKLVTCDYALNDYNFSYWPLCFGMVFHSFVLISMYDCIRMHRKKGQFTSKASEDSTGLNAEDSMQEESTQETLYESSI